ncbi:MAG TPA: nickel pincer cofactor biosynthesis protein LarC [Planctomycetota bacterium]|nr:nickel pincer cofactor biosynthesis protein LarC [Planctomycetota bacterium]
MMRIAVLDAWSGVAGDMWVGALLDAGVPLAPLAAAVRSLQLPGVSIRATRVLRAGLAGTQFHVDGPGSAAPGSAGGEPVFAPVPRGEHAGVLLPGKGAHGHRGLAEIEAIVQRADLPAAVVTDCLSTYRAIGAVEAAAHGCAIDEVHFHEVGAEDTIVDVVCACLGTHLLGVERLYANGIAVGSGTVRTAHGLLPVPAPATAALLRGIPVRSGGLAGERTTPTGAALLRTLVAEFDASIAFTAEAIGYGAGTRDDPAVPNLLRLTVGAAVERSAATELVELQCQLDTATGEQVGWLLDELLRRGALDAFATPLHMKKGRPGLLLTALCDEARAGPLTELLLEESSSLGVRRHRVQRAVLERWQETRETPLGPVEFKVARLPSGVAVARPEDRELRRLCEALGLGRAEVLRRLLS